MAIAGGSLIKRRLRQRFGIRAAKVTVRTHVPWYLWWLLLALSCVLVLGLGSWVYDSGRRLAGFDSSASQREIEALRGSQLELQAEVSRLRKIADTSESQLQIERTAGQQLARQVKVLEQEAVSLREDLSFFEGLVPVGESQKDAGPSISRLRIETDMDGRFRYRMLIIQRGGKGQSLFRGSLQLAVRLEQNGKDVMMLLPASGDADNPKYRLEIKHFQRAEGIISIPSGARIKSVEARLLQNGVMLTKQVSNL